MKKKIKEKKHKMVTQYMFKCSIDKIFFTHPLDFRGHLEAYSIHDNLHRNLFNRWKRLMKTKRTGVKFLKEFFIVDVR